MPTQSVKEVTGLFKALSDETRLRILVLLQINELAVGELQKILQVGQSVLSSHLGQLRDQRLVTTRKEGQRVYYRLSHTLPSDKNYHIITQAIGEIKGSNWLQKDARRLNQILSEREDFTKKFFDSLKDKDLDPPGQSWESISDGLMQVIDAQTIIDLGCGIGRLTLKLGKFGKDVIGVDNSAERVKTANNYLALTQTAEYPDTRSPLKVRFIKAKMEQTKLPPESCELILISQALHHVADPPAVLREAHRLLIPRGKILLLDLAPHQEDWMRKKFGDFWLGFSPEDLKEWLIKCGFRDILINYSNDFNKHSKIETIIITAKK